MSFCTLTCFASQVQTENQYTYTLYCGLNDAATGTQLLSIQEAQKIARKIILDHKCGYTEIVSYGAYQENDKVIGNDTLIYKFIFSQKTIVEKIAKEIKNKLNLVPILMVEEISSYNFLEQ